MSQAAHHRIIFARHAQSAYSNIYPDITEEGIRQLEELSGCLSVPHLIVASPAIRAQGSAHILARTLRYKHQIETEPLLADMNYADWPAAKTIFEQCRIDHEGVENIYDIDSRFEDASIFEPRSAVRLRFYMYLQKLINRLEDSPDQQNILIVSHFEILNHFVQKFFPESPWLGAGKYFSLQFKNKDHTEISYENFSKQISLTDILASGQQASLVVADNSLKS